MTENTQESTGHPAEQAQDTKSAATAPLSSREKITNAIPLLLALVAVIYFIYSCRDNQGLAKSQGIFIQEYQSSCVDFDKELEQYLAGETSTEDFQKAVRESYLPRMKSLQNTCDTMSKRTADSIPCMNELRQIIDLKTELAGIMLEKPFLSRADMPQDIREIFKKISSLEKTVQEKCSQTNE